MTDETIAARFGYVAIVGRPNVGKSTLLNALVGQKIAAESRRRHTTRNRILGIVTVENAQIALVDTPGLEAHAQGLLARTMAKIAASTLHGVDLVLMLVEAAVWTPDDEIVLARVREAGVPVIIGLTKIDRLKDRSTLLPFIDEVRRRFAFADIIPLSALKGVNVDAVISSLIVRLPEGDFHFSGDQVTDRSERFLATEIIREQMMEQLGQELPYAAWVEIESFKAARGAITIGAVISVEREGQKAIVIGKGGHRIKAIGMAARRELEAVLGSRVHLSLWVRVREDWRQDMQSLQDAGIDLS